METQPFSRRCFDAMYPIPEPQCDSARTAQRLRAHIQRQRQLTDKLTQFSTRVTEVIVRAGAERAGRLDEDEEKELWRMLGEMVRLSELTRAGLERVWSALYEDTGSARRHCDDGLADLRQAVDRESRRFQRFLCRPIDTP